MSRRWAATGLATGLALMAAAPIVWWATLPAPAGETVSTVNAAAAVELASPTPMSSGALVPTETGLTSVVAPSTSAEPPAAAVQLAPLPEAVPASAPAPTPEPAPAPAAAPARIELPTLGVDTDVVPVGVDDNGLMDIPQDVNTVGWYRYGPAPGAAAGSAVLSGHVDDYRQGVGVFGRIGDLGPGDTVRIVDEAGVTREFSVLSREEWSKGEVPLDRIFDRGGQSRLVLITCGGSFNSSTLGYDDNVAITAVPVGQ
jgi:sortase (surface protein transpeptidase)